MTVQERIVPSHDRTNSMAAGLIAARIERLPIAAWHLWARLLIGTATFFDAFAALTIAQVLPVIVPLWHLSAPQTGFLISIGYVGQVCGALFFGWLAERFGRLPALMLTTTIFALMSIACGLADSYHALLVFRTIQGFGFGGEVPIAAVYISEIAKTKGRGRFVLLYENIFSLGIVLSGLIGSVVVPTLGWRCMFFFGAAPIVVVPLLARLLPESPRWLASKGRIEEADAAISRIETTIKRTTGKLLPAVQHTAPVEFVKSSWRDIIGRHSITKTIVVWTLWFTGYLVYYGVGTWLPTFYRTVFHLSITHALRYGMLANIGVFGGSVICALIIDAIGRRRLFITALIGQGVSLLILWGLGATSVAEVALLSTIACIFSGAAGMGAYLYTPEVYPTRSRAIATSIGSSWLRVASMLGPFIVGMMVGHGIGSVFLLFAIVPLVASALVARLAVETSGRSLEEIEERDLRFTDPALVQNEPSSSPLHRLQDSESDGPAAGV
jgi:MFS transporter, putative metabolite:H+ symporter